MDDIAIKVEGVGKTFKLPHEKQTSLKGAFINLFKGGNRSFERQHALKDITFDVKKGEFFGIVGRNGSGKSTMLKLLAGIYAPTKGTIAVNGKLTPFIELGVGFSPELSGRDNVFLNGSLLGFNRKEMEGMYQDIVDFAELERFMDQKLKNYSSGMQVRLAFSIAIRARSDILLLDEVLAVGDADFQRKCLRYFTYLKNNKKTVVFVSHDMESIRKYCDRVILIEDGNIKLEGIPRKVITEFMSGFVEHNEENSPNVEKNGVAASNLPLGIAEAVTTDKTLLKIDRVWLENLEGQKIDEIDKNTNEYYVKFIIEAKKDIQKVVPGVIVTNELGDFVVAVNSKWAGSSLKTTLTDKNKYLIKFKLLNIYEQGNYKISVNVVSEDFNTFYAWKNEVCSLYVNRPYVTGGKVNPPSTVEITEL